MPNHLNFCSCHNCRLGLRTKCGGETVRRTIRRFRRLTKQQLKRGEEPLTRISVPYTD